MANRNSAHAKKVTAKKERTLFIDLPAKTQKTIGLIVAGVILVIFACVILKQYDLLPRLDGRLRYYNEKVYGTEEGILYTNKSGTTKARVYAVAEFTSPEGFYDEKEPMRSTSEVTNLCYGRDVKRNEDIGDGLKYVTVKGMNKTAEQMVESIIEVNTVKNEDGTVIEPTFVEGKAENGLEYTGLVSKTMYADDSKTYAIGMPLYINAKHGCCVLVMPYYAAATEEELPTADEMQKLAEEIKIGRAHV